MKIQCFMLLTQNNYFAIIKPINKTKQFPFDRFYLSWLLLLERGLTFRFFFIFSPFFLQPSSLSPTGRQTGQDLRKKDDGPSRGDIVVWRVAFKPNLQPPSSWFFLFRYIAYKIYATYNVVRTFCFK